jgi:hypothetical protein
LNHNLQGAVTDDDCIFRTRTRYLDWIAGPWNLTLYGTNATHELCVTNIGSASEHVGRRDSSGCSRIDCAETLNPA